MNYDEKYIKSLKAGDLLELLKTAKPDILPRIIENANQEALGDALNNEALTLERINAIITACPTNQIVIITAPLHGDKFAQVLNTVNPDMLSAIIENSSWNLNSALETNIFNEERIKQIIDACPEYRLAAVTESLQVGMQQDAESLQGGMQQDAESLQGGMQQDAGEETIDAKLIKLLNEPNADISERVAEEFLATTLNHKDLTPELINNIIEACSDKVDKIVSKLEQTKLIELLNAHETNIPEIDATLTLDRINAIIEACHDKVDKIFSHLYTNRLIELLNDQNTNIPEIIDNAKEKFLRDALNHDDLTPERINQIITEHSDKVDKIVSHLYPPKLIELLNAHETNIPAIIDNARKEFLEGALNFRDLTRGRINAIIAACTSDVQIGKIASSLNANNLQELLSIAPRDKLSIIIKNANQRYLEGALNHEGLTPERINEIITACPDDKVGDIALYLNENKLRGLLPLPIATDNKLSIIIENANQSHLKDALMHEDLTPERIHEIIIHTSDVQINKIASCLDQDKLARVLLVAAMTSDQFITIVRRCDVLESAGALYQIVVDDANHERFTSIITGVSPRDIARCIIEQVHLEVSIRVLNLCSNEFTAQILNELLIESTKSDTDKNIDFAVRSDIVKDILNRFNNVDKCVAFFNAQTTSNQSLHNDIINSLETDRIVQILNHANLKPDVLITLFNNLSAEKRGGVMPRLLSDTFVVIFNERTERNQSLHHEIIKGLEDAKIVEIFNHANLKPEVLTALFNNLEKTKRARIISRLLPQTFVAIYGQKYNEKVQEIEQSLVSTIEGAQKHIAAVSGTLLESSIEQRVQTIKKSIDDFDNIMQILRKSLSEDLNSIPANMRDDVETLVTKKFQELEGLLRKKVVAIYEQKYDKKVKQVHTKLIAPVTQKKEEIERLEEESKTTLSKKMKAELEQKITPIQETINDLISDLPTKFDENMQQVREELEKDLENVPEDMRDDVKTSVTKKFQDLEGLLRKKVEAICGQKADQQKTIGASPTQPDEKMEKVSKQFKGSNDEILRNMSPKLYR